MQISFKQVLIGLSFSAALALAPAHAAIVYQTGTNTSSIPGLTGFATTGAMMDGMSVTATFANGFSETVVWGDSGPNAGSALGTRWSLSLDGDTFSADWLFTNNDRGQLVTLTLDGRTGLTVFDRTDPSFGTDGSAQGLDWTCRSAGLCDDAIVFYDYATGIGSDDPVGDLFQLVSIDFGQAGPRSDFAFGQDTDNDSRLTDVPEPATLMLLGAALAVAGASKRRSA